MKEYCYLALCGPKRKTISALLRDTNVLRVTDHDSHIKVVTRRPWKVPDGIVAERVKDQTTHWDVEYWAFAMMIARHTQSKRQDPAQAFKVMVHYLANLWVLPEAEFCEWVAAGRRYLSAAVSDEEAHGWELPIVERLKARKRGWEP